VEPLAPLSGLRRKVAALLPLPLFTRRGGDAAQGGLTNLFPAGAHVTTAVAERAAAIVAAAALAGAGGMALSADEQPAGPRDDSQKQRIEQPAPESRDERAGSSSRLADLGVRAEGRVRNEPGTARDERIAAGRQREAKAAEPTAGLGGPPDQAAETGDTSEGGRVGLPDLGAIGGGGGSGGSSDGPDLPLQPIVPRIEPQSSPGVPLAAPGVEAPRSEAVAPPVPELPAAAQLEAVTGIAAG
jgi:hypothetical protein